MNTKLKKWATVGLGTAFLGTGLVACGSEEQAATPAKDEAAVEKAEDDGHSHSHSDDSHSHSHDSHSHAGEMGEGEGGEGGEGGEAGPDMDTLALPQRLAFMTGHVEAGLALYRAGAPEMAAPHLLHPVSETHAAERAGLDALGFDASLFEAVSKALEEGRPAEEIEPQLEAAEANLASVAEKAGGDTVEVITFLMDVIVEEYTIAITDGVVTDANEYQDAYGFAIVARDRAETFDPRAEDLIAEIDALIGLWPEAPIPPEDPAPVGQVSAQASKVILALPAAN
ncbi:MAG: hypothetical protein AAGC95_05640 [Pseudomonadota bacterium]